MVYRGKSPKNFPKIAILLQKQTQKKDLKKESFGVENRPKKPPKKAVLKKLKNV